MRRLILPATLPLLLGGLLAFSLAGARKPPWQVAGATHPAGESVAVFFDWDQSSLSLHGRASLRRASRLALDGHDTRLEVLAAEEPHASPAYVASLTRARWASIQAALTLDGIDGAQLVHTGEGRAILRHAGSGLIASVAQVDSP